jgi:RNA polymerase sigma factor (sigma-70 family)
MVRRASCGQGLTSPFDTVVEEHGAAVMRVCRALLGPVDAQDAWSDTFLAALEAYPRLRPDSDVRAWLATIAHHKAIDHLRRAARHAIPTGDLPDVASLDSVAHVDDDELRAAVQGLPFKQRAAVAYRYLADLGYPEIAAILDCSEAAARRSAADGIAALRARSPTPAPRKARA